MLAACVWNSTKISHTKIVLTFNDAIMKIKEEKKGVSGATRSCCTLSQWKHLMCILIFVWTIFIVQVIQPGVIKKKKKRNHTCTKAHHFLPKKDAIFNFIKTHPTGNVGRGQGWGIFNDMAAIKILHSGGYVDWRAQSKKPPKKQEGMLSANQWRPDLMCYNCKGDSFDLCYICVWYCIPLLQRMFR